MDGNNISLLHHWSKLLIVFLYICFILIASKLQHKEQDKLNLLTETQVKVWYSVLTRKVSITYNFERDEANNIYSISLEKTFFKGPLPLDVFPSNLLSKSAISPGNGCSPRKDALQDVFKKKTTSLRDLFCWRIPNTTINDSSPAFVYPVLADTESVGIQESHNENPDNVAAEAEQHGPVQATDATEYDVYTHPALADRQNEHNDVMLHAEGAVGGDDAVSANYDHYENVVVDVHGLGYPRDASQIARQEYLQTDPMQRTLEFTADEPVKILVGRKEREEPIPDNDTDPVAQGREDLVRCYHCGIGLKDWSDGDEPLFEHTRHSPNCLFLKELLREQLLNTNRENLEEAQRPIELASSQGSETRPTQQRARRVWHPGMTTLDQRSGTFKEWPSSNGQQPETLANAGFFFTGREDLVRCYLCGIGLKDWSDGDGPLFEHTRHSPNCLFLKDMLGEQLLNTNRENQRPNETARSQGSEPCPAQQLNRQVLHPGMTTLAQRLGTFNEWPQSTGQQPEALAEAGLFFTGINDLCRCFTCDGGLQRWDREDDPGVEHARSSPDCRYVREMKGQRYINMVHPAAQREQLEVKND
ncbi:uncharacterized protein LOC128237762 [Mya arenaria]|uniref:uncharacterized protein LOC128237762 n=1 Tax=Mya arenaria TaxID=6604 RepID=UPI0022E86CF8|nr:uncharacterized protein LOC128237762 [Mya arenaria]